MSAKLEPSTEPYLPRASLVSPLHHTNPFYQSQTSTPTLSPCNPFFSVLQQTPSFEDMLTTPLNPPPPPLPFLSSSRPDIGQFFPEASSANPSLTHDSPATDGKGGTITRAGKRHLPPALTEGEMPLSRRGTNPFLPAREPEWDESFEAFAAGRLQSLEDTTTGCAIQQNSPGGRPLERRNNTRALPPVTDADHGTNVRDATHPQAHKAVSQVGSTNKHMLETIPEHLSFESDHITLNASSPTLDACAETSPTNGRGTNTNDLPSTNAHQAPCCTSSTKPDSSSPDLGSSGLGSSAEEDFLSCLSSHSDKFSASSCEEAESSFLGFDKSEPAEEIIVEPSEPGGDVTDRINDVPPSRSPLWPDQQLILTAGQNETKAENTLFVCEEVDPDLLPKLSKLQLNSDSSSLSYDESRHQHADEFGGLVIDFSSSPVNTKHVMNPTIPGDQLCSTIPPLFITTSSPVARRSLLGSPLESTTLAAQDARQHSPVPFGEFLTANPIQDLHSTLHYAVSDQGSGSFLQSLYVSADSQIYQIGESHAYFSVSEPNETQHSAGTASGPEAAPRPPSREIDRRDRATVEPSFITEKQAQTGSNVSGSPTKITDRGLGSQHVILGGECSEYPQTQSAPLHRSQSEGTLTPFFDKVVLPSFGSDPGAIKESSTAQPGAGPLCLSSCPLSLTPENIRSPVALCSLPPLAKASPKSPPISAPDAAPKPPEPKQQQAANQQNR